MKYGSVCSGIEAASVAWEALGWKAAWLSEIEPFPSAVLANHYPSVVNLGDMTKIAPYIRMGDVEAPDILVGGTPCQAFSVAGSRKGLDDARGQLTLEFVKLANAIDMRREEEHEQKCIIVWENVPGVLSSKDNAFGCFLAALAGEDDELQPLGKRWPNAGAVFGPKRAIAWRVLDAQYFGLAQRRRRVFLVASARAGFHPAQVLFEREGLRRDSAPSRGTGQDIACTLDARTEGGGFPGTDGATGGHVVAPPAWPKVFGGNNTSGPIDVATACRAKGGTGHGDFESETFVVAGTLQANGKAAGSATQQDAESGLLVVHGTQDPDLLLDQAHPLGRNHGQENAVFAIQAGALRTNPASGPDGVGVQADHAYTLEARAEVQAVCVTGEVTHTLKADGFDGSEDGTGRGQPIVAAVAGTIGANHGNVKAEHAWTGQLAGVGSAVRRLTPRETERLQGFPDDWTLIPWRGKPASDCPDGPRYKAIGNSKAVPVVRRIGQRIEKAINNPWSNDL